VQIICCLQGYSPSIFYPKRTDKPLYHALTTQCVKMGLSFVDSLPSSDKISQNYDVIVDALFGFSFQGPPRGEFATLISNIVESRVPVLSVDVPSGISTISLSSKTIFYPRLTLLLFSIVFPAPVYPL